MKKSLLSCTFCILLNCITYSQNPPVVTKFWNLVAEKYNYHLMNAGMKSWLLTLAQKKSVSYSSAIGILENLKNEYSFQNYVFTELYVKSPKNKENIRMILGSMCGSFSIGNPVADYVIQKYSHDPKAQKKIKDRTEEANKQAALEAKREQEQETIRQNQEKEEKERQQKEEERKKIEEQEEKNSINVYAPQFKTGNFNNFISKNLYYPDSSVKYNRYGVITVRFTIDTIGNVINAKAVSNWIGYGLEEEALRVINLSSGKWIPAKKENTQTPINYSTRINIHFKSPDGL